MDRGFANVFVANTMIQRRNYWNEWWEWCSEINLDPTSLMQPINKNSKKQLVFRPHMWWRSWLMKLIPVQRSLPQSQYHKLDHRNGYCNTPPLLRKYGQYFGNIGTILYGFVRRDNWMLKWHQWKLIYWKSFATVGFNNWHDHRIY